MRKNKEGLLLAASFSYGCQTAKMLSIDRILEKYAENGGKNCSEEKIRKILSKLAPYFFYRAISLANDIEDPFDFRVVKAYWIGNELLKKVKPFHIKQTLKEFKKEGRDVIPFVWAIKPILQGKHPCHNCHIRDLSCAVTIQDRYFWHFGKRRMKAAQKDIRNFQKYGKE